MRGLILFFLCVLFSSCTSIHFRSEDNIPVFITPRPEHHQPVEIKGKKNFYLWGLIPSSRTVLLDKEFADSGIGSVANVRVREYQNFGSFLWQIFTLGFYVPRNYHLSGYGLWDEGYRGRLKRGYSP